MMKAETKVQTNTSPSRSKEISQVLDTEGGVMPDPHHKKQTPQEEEVIAVFKNFGRKPFIKK